MLSPTLLTEESAAECAKQAEEWFGIIYDNIIENQEAGGSFFPILMALGMVAGGVATSCVLEDCERLGVSVEEAFDPEDGLHLMLIKSMNEMGIIYLTPDCISGSYLLIERQSGLETRS